MRLLLSEFNAPNTLHLNGKSLSLCPRAGKDQSIVRAGYKYQWRLNFQYFLSRIVRVFVSSLVRNLHVFSGLPQRHFSHKAVIWSGILQHERFSKNAYFVYMKVQSYINIKTPNLI